MIPGEYHLLPDELTMNEGYDAIEVECKNDGDRPIQIGSHFHFYEVNSALTFDRKLAWGKWLDIAAGTAVRFEAGESKKVPLVDMGGKRRCYGFNDLVNGFLNDDSNIE